MNQFLRRKNDDDVFTLAERKYCIMSGEPPKEEIFICLDIRADGESPATSSLRMVGASAMRLNVDPTKKPYMVNTYHWCLKTQWRKTENKAYMKKFWGQHQEVWKHICSHGIPVEQFMREFIFWCSELSKRHQIRLVVMNPASHVWQWINAIQDQYGAPDTAILPYPLRCLGEHIHFLLMVGMDERRLSELLTCPSESLSRRADQSSHVYGYQYLMCLKLVKENLVTPWD